MPQDTRPNVLLICTDHWPGSLLGCAGHPSVLTPTLDQLASNGVRFPNAYSECPVCVPARRTLMTGLAPHDHGMLQNDNMPMPDVPTVAQAFRDAGYQANAVGKLHVQPQRQRIGFDEVLLDEEGRGHEGCRADDYELFLADHGHAGERFASGMNNNEYTWRPWQLDESLHVTNWAAKMMARQIIRRDPLRPGFWYLSFSHPHPPLNPLQAYLDIYRDIDVPDPFIGDWAAGDHNTLEIAIQREIQGQLNHNRNFKPEQIRAIRRAFYAHCTHIDHQLRIVLGTLRQEGMMDNTIVCFTADHGDMLGNHRLWAKHWMYEDSARVPMILVGTKQQSEDGTVGHGRVDERLIGLRDVMPTLLELAGITPPRHCQGTSMVGRAQREHLFGAWGYGSAGEGGASTRMVRTDRYKLVYYATGNCVQLFDMREDPYELHNIAGDPKHADTLAALTAKLIDELPGDEKGWSKDGRLVGVPNAQPMPPRPNRNFSGQRGLHMPTPRVGDIPW